MSLTGEKYNAERAELQNVLNSGIFDRSPNLSRFLAFVCDKYFAGRTDEVKEYSVAVEALGRDVEFDPKRDSIVRVEAHRLRKRLEKYYQSEGAEHPIHITLPAGSYIPEFTRGAQPALAEILQPPADSAITPAASVAVAENAPSSTGPTPTVSPAHRWEEPTAAAAAKPTGTWQRYLLPAVAMLALAVAIAVWVAREPTKIEGKEPAAEAPAMAASSAAAGAIPNNVAVDDNAGGIRILAGSKVSSYIDRLGRTWTGDAYFAGGSAQETKVRLLHFTQLPELYAHRREGEFSYDIPVPPGHYELRLHFAEPIFGEDKIAGGGETSRLFHIAINGQRILSEFDIVADAFGEDNADVRVFRNVQPAEDGKVHIQFSSGAHEWPLVSAIELLPTEPGRIRPLRMVASDRGFRESPNAIWLADNYFSGGRPVRREPLSDSKFPENLFTGERYGNFTYMIPTAPDGRYRIRLYFCERWFGPGTHAGGGAGSRVFDVYCNGQALLTNFDVFREAGGLDKPIVREFAGIAPNAQGKLILQFIPKTNYAMLNAMEVIDEGLP